MPARPTTPELSLARVDGSGRRTETYVLTNPLRRYAITPRGDIRRRIGARSKVVAGATAAAGAVVVGSWAAATAASTGRGITRFVVMGTIGLTAVGALVGLTLWLWSAISAARDMGRNTADVFVAIAPSQARAWRLCAIAEAISEVGSWRDRTVDPRRRVAGVLWSAVRRCLEVDQLEKDLERASAHQALAELADEARARIDHDRDTLDRVQLNLGKVLLAARAIDQQRRDAARAAERRRAREREEAELRKRLGDTLATNTPGGTDDEVERSAGIAIEAETVAELLRDSDRILREPD